MHKSIPLEPEVRKQLGKQAGALPLYCLTLGLALLWARNLGFPKFGCCRLEMYWPKLGQGGREAAAFQGNISEGDSAAGLGLRCKSPLALKQISWQSEEVELWKGTKWGFGRWAGRSGDSASFSDTTLTCRASCCTRWLWHKKAPQSCWRCLADELFWSHHWAAA